MSQTKGSGTIKYPGYNSANGLVKTKGLRNCRSKTRARQRAADGARKRRFEDRKKARDEEWDSENEFDKDSRKDKWRT